LSTVFCFFVVFVTTQCESHGDAKTPGWCGTVAPGSSEKRQINSCGIGNQCEDPLTRAAYFVQPGSALMTVRLRFLFFGITGPNPQTIADVADLMDTTTKAYEPAQINFEYTIDYNPTKEFNGISANNAILVSRMKATYAVSPGSQLNIFVPENLLDNLLGWAIFPNDPDALNSQGGIVMTRSEVASGKFTLPHEMGHSFGLYHTFAGSEVTDGQTTCNPCAEMVGTAAGDTTGDGITDTPPTCENYLCSDPTVLDCQGKRYVNTDFRNYMGYGPNSCLESGRFSQQQIGRMRCFIERVLTGYLSTTRVCSVPADCDDGLACTFETCVNGGCVTRVNRCENTTVQPCEVATCDPADGICKVNPRNCTSPPSLPCANASCNTATDRCLTDFSQCSTGSFTNDCCTAVPTPFCNDTAIMNCVCTQILSCCTQAWSPLCTSTVALCSDTRDCLAETLADPVNTDCETAQDMVDEFAIFKSALDDDDVFDCLGATVRTHGAWWRASGKDYTYVSMDTCQYETAVDTTIYIFDGCISSGGQCIAKQLSSSSCTARADIVLAPDEEFWFFIGSQAYGTIKVDFNVTENAQSSPPPPIPIAAVVALVVLSVLSIIVIAVIVYVLTKANSYQDLP